MSAGAKIGTGFAARRAAGVLALGAVLAGLAGCATSSVEQQRTETIYAQYAARMAERGRFREEFRPTDVIYTNAQLVRHFDKVVFLPEIANDRFRQIEPETRTLAKWAHPIRYSFDRKPELLDIATVARVLADFQNYSGLDIAPARAPEEPNLVIYVLDTAERAALLNDRDEDAYPSPILEAWVEELELPCFGLYRTQTIEGGEILRAAIFVKDELRDPFRRACFVEELSQALGLSNDHDDIRPSIFNDDQEFIALTEHDSYLMRLLYHPRMRAGMPRDEAVGLARELVDGIRQERSDPLAGQYD